MALRKATAFCCQRLSTGKWNVHRYAKAAFAENKCLGTRVIEDGTVGEYRWMPYGEVGTARTAIGSGLVQHGILKGSCVGLYMINRAEWIISELACAAYSYVSVPLYDTLGADAVTYIVNHAEVAAVFCTPDKLQTLLNCLSELPSLRLIVVVGGAEHLVPSLPSQSGIEIVPHSRTLNLIVPYSSIFRGCPTSFVWKPRAGI
ncbi:long chain acyl-CoA synthetase 6, peroxisomal [Physcomitrium patens]|uniref:long chain acyl-CoA synthetase 6, peroxisomal n=1 Tax=Physcomitrium patens TaxID=3218 RepID=UPI003CCDB2A4